MLVKVNNEKEFEAALADAFSYEDTVLVEEFIDGREFSVAVLDGKALPVIEIEPLGATNFSNVPVTLTPFTYAVLFLTISSAVAVASLVSMPPPLLTDVKLTD